MLASLPLAAVQPTPFQRDLSPTHAKRLAEKIDETGAFLDPLIVVRGEEGRFWTPNGRHRLAAAKMLGLRQITALVSPEESLAYRILALNTEKAHNLKDKSLEVMRMAKNLAKRDGQRRESEFAPQFEAADLLTLGLTSPACRWRLAIEPNQEARPKRPQPAGRGLAQVLRVGRIASRDNGVS